jgi:hypothetical protein
MKSFFLITLFLYSITSCVRKGVHVNYPPEVLNKGVENQYHIAQLELYKFFTQNRCDCLAFAEGNTTLATSLMPHLIKLESIGDTILFSFDYGLNNGKNEFRKFGPEENFYKNCWPAWQIIFVGKDLVPYRAIGSEDAYFSYSKNGNEKLDSNFVSCLTNYPNQFHPIVNELMQATLNLK